jgi:hypothetical protein
MENNSFSSIGYALKDPRASVIYLTTTQSNEKGEFSFCSEVQLKRMNLSQSNVTVARGKKTLNLEVTS